MTQTPHDAFFKAVYSNPEHARGELRSVVPPALAETLDWATLALEPGSFVDPALTFRHTDLLFSVRWRAGGDALVYLLFEHQSTTDPVMALRLLGYLVRIWEHWLAEHPNAQRLPAIDLVELAGRELGPEAKDATMTGAQRLIEQGIQLGKQEGIQLGKQEGIQLGKQEGIQLGEQRGRQQMLMNVLRLRFGDQVTADVEHRVEAASPEQFEAWVERMLSAATLRELLDA